MLKSIIFTLEMTSKIGYTEEKQTGCILLVALLLSIFSLSGVLCNSQHLQQATQIELLLSNSLESTKSAVYIYETFEKYEPLTTSFTKICKVNYLFCYQRFIETQFKSVLLQAVCCKTSDHFYQVKTIPQNSKEDSFISFVG